jgi:hypothetical protein
VIEHLQLCTTKGGRIVSVAAIIAVAANTDGKREINWKRVPLCNNITLAIRHVPAAQVRRHNERRSVTPIQRSG